MTITIVGKSRTVQKPCHIVRKIPRLSPALILTLIKEILAAWSGEKNKTLADNYNFGAIMNRCKGTKDERPQILWFVDPINIHTQFCRAGNRG